MGFISEATSICRNTDLVFFPARQNPASAAYEFRNSWVPRQASGSHMGPEKSWSSQFSQRSLSLIPSWNRPSADVEAALADLERQRVLVKVLRTQPSGGTRKNPPGFKNAHAAISRSNDTQDVIWARAEKHPGVWQVFPGGAVIQWPEGDAMNALVIIGSSGWTDKAARPARYRQGMIFNRPPAS